MTTGVTVFEDDVYVQTPRVLPDNVESIVDVFAHKMPIEDLKKMRGAETLGGEKKNAMIILENDFSQFED
eukprot:CAMPEP_0168318376 /NCGR_PEP_ID=MMETSP0213-20121227/443_1 /TAXON_ID=151035 /ORGANISM="Euplotes harpa, Strain FSP1.4" /LENGTH=69 /DNA_ID=CAMNT_0008319433 /DNA_START=1590 /DNA_END=1799 /DNA_ORIENTATION=-